MIINRFEVNAFCETFKNEYMVNIRQRINQLRVAYFQPTIGPFIGAPNNNLDDACGVATLNTESRRSTIAFGTPCVGYHGRVSTEYNSLRIPLSSLNKNQRGSVIDNLPICQGRRIVINAGCHCYDTTSLLRQGYFNHHNYFCGAIIAGNQLVPISSKYGSVQFSF